MNKVLVTGPTRFLGFHVIKLLNKRGIRPRILIEAGKQTQPDRNSLPKKEYKTAITNWNAYQSMKYLDVDEVLGNVNDTNSLLAACEGIDTIFHLKFGLGFGDSEDVKKQLHFVNVMGTNNVLNAAETTGVKRVIVSSSALAVGLNPDPKLLNEDADWDTYKFNFPYAVSRREAELEALKRPEGKNLPVIVVINPSFTMGPDDYVKAPANSLVKNMAKRWFRFTAPIGFGILDVRDYAKGALLAAEKGRHGQRYILSGDNVSSEILLKEIADITGNKPPQWLITIPACLVSILLRIISFVKGEPLKQEPTITELWGKNAWYDTHLARKELGWRPLPLRKTLEDTLNWKPKSNFHS
jgi:dihydroflavonol-4-reductase